MFKDIFSFEGRIRRTEWGVSTIIYFIAYFIVYGLMIWASDLVDYGSTQGLWAIFFCVVAMVPLCWFLWAQAAKRCHDVGKSGWWQLIPLYSFIIIFIEGDKGANEYGEDPKA